MVANLKKLKWKLSWAVLPPKWVVDGEVIYSFPMLLAKVWGWKGNDERLEELEKQLSVIIGLEDKGGTDICKSCRKTIKPHAEAEHQLNGPIRSNLCFVTQDFEDGSLGFVIGFSQKHSIKIMTEVDVNNPEDFRAYRRREPQMFVFKAWLYHGELEAGKELADAESKPVLALEKNFSSPGERDIQYKLYNSPLRRDDLGNRI